MDSVLSTLLLVPLQDITFFLNEPFFFTSTQTAKVLDVIICETMHTDITVAPVEVPSDVLG